MNDNSMQESKKLNLEGIIHEKDIDRGNSTSRYVEKRKGLSLLLVTGIMAGITVLLVIYSVIGYTK